MEMSTINRQKTKSKSDNPLLSDELSTVETTSTPNPNAPTAFEIWLKSNRAITDLDPSADNETFTDASGVLRYTDNWLPAVADKRSLLDKTGCIEKSLDFLQTDPQEQTDKIRFLADWKILWDYFENDPIDELAVHAPLLRIYIEFFFHRRTAQFVTLLVIYNVILKIALFRRYHVLSPSRLGFAVAACTLQTIIYLALRVLYKGSLYGETTHSSLINNHTQHNHNNLNSNNKNSKRNQKDKNVYIYSVHWSSTFMQILHTSIQEIKSLLNFNKKHRYNRTENKLTYYTLMNISLKFLTRHDGLTMKEINFNRWTYRVALLTLLFGIPFYIYFYNYYPYSTGGCSSNWNQSSACQWLLYNLIFSCGNVLPFLLHYCFAASVIVALVGLAYGGEIAYRLCHSWNNRYDGLRRLALPVQSADNSRSLNDASGTEKPDDSDDDDKHDKTEIALLNDNSNRETQNIDKISAIDQQPQLVLDDYNSNINSSNKSNSNINTSIKRQTTHSTTDKTNKQLIQQQIESKELKLIHFASLLPRDATEHYLFIREFMNQAGRIWSIGLVGIFFTFIYIVISYLYVLFTEAIFITQLILIQFILFMVIRFVFFIIYPIVSLSHANSFVYSLQENFLIAAPEDFAIIGGRDIWLNFLTSAPAVWSVFGIWITWDKLFGFLWMLLSGVAAVGITIVSSSV